MQRRACFWAWFVFVLVSIFALPGYSEEINLAKSGQLYEAQPDQPFPQSATDLSDWLQTQKRVDRVRLTGGSYWLYGEVRANVIEPMVFDPNNSLIEHVEAYIYDADGKIQRLTTGYAYPREFSLHYGKSVNLRPGETYRVLVHFTSRYYASFPRFEFLPRSDYQHQVLVNNLLAIGAFGALAALAVFNFFIFVLVREKSHLYYSIYLVTFLFGWLFPFQVLTQLWGFQDLRWHYLPIFLCPLTCGLFCIEFLRLRQDAPQLAWWIGVPAVIAALLGISCFVALPYAHILASGIVAIWMPIALTVGIIRWRQGFRPARFFVFAFSALMVGGAVLLPPNLGLTTDIVRNAELVTLLAGTVDAMLLAFALADRIRDMIEERERNLKKLNEAVQIAHTDALTGIGNRYALDQFLQRGFTFGADVSDSQQQLLALLDVDGLKQINDQLGHVKGDELLRIVANGLRNTLGPRTQCYRLGGDEFAVIAHKFDESTLHAGIAQIEHLITERELTGAGLSYGIAYSHESASPSQLLSHADRRMYRNKHARKQGKEPAPATGFGIQTI